MQNVTFNCFLLPINKKYGWMGIFNNATQKTKCQQI